MENETIDELLKALGRELKRLMSREEIAMAKDEEISALEKALRSREAKAQVAQDITEHHLNVLSDRDAEIRELKKAMQSQEAEYNMRILAKNGEIGALRQLIEVYDVSEAGAIKGFTPWSRIRNLTQVSMEIKALKEELQSKDAELTRVRKDLEAERSTHITTWKMLEEAREKLATRSIDGPEKKFARWDALRQERNQLVKNLEMWRALHLELLGSEGPISVRAAITHLRQERDAALEKERAWEKMMMELLGQDGLGSVRAAIENLKAARALSYREGHGDATQFWRPLVEKVVESTRSSEWTPGGGHVDKVPREVMEFLKKHLKYGKEAEKDTDTEGAAV